MLHQSRDMPEKTQSRSAVSDDLEPYLPMYLCGPRDQLLELLVPVSGMPETLSNEWAESASKKTEVVRLNYAWASNTQCGFPKSCCKAYMKKNLIYLIYIEIVC